LGDVYLELVFLNIGRSIVVTDLQHKKPEEQQLVTSIKILKDALPKMTHLDIPPTPENYAVWYEYSQGSILKLNAQIDDLIRHQNSFSSSLNHQLYLQYIAPQSAETLELAQSNTEVLVRSLMGKIQSMYSGTNHFSSELEHFQQMLSKRPDIETLSKLVAGLLDETEKVSQANNQMKDSLAKMGDKVQSLKESMVVLSQVALTDSLTGIANRRAFDDMVVTLLQQPSQVDGNCCLLILDIDHFKLFNDTFGHSVGDKVLIYVASAISNAVKGDDFVARFGGEEFVVLLPDTDYEGGIAVAEHIRIKIGANKLATNQGKTNMGYVAISIGVASMSLLDNALSLTERADRALYQAKNTGRNKVVGERDL
jgi:diguanylate cyclase